MKIFKCTLVLLFFCYSSFAQFRVEVNYPVFNIPDDTSYLELQYLIPGDGLTYVLNSENRYQGSVLASVTLQPVSSPNKTIDREMRFITDEYDNALPEGKNDKFFLMRIPLPQGDYNLYVCIKDEQKKESKPLCFSRKVSINFNQNKVCMSNIQSIASVKQAESESIFSKNGLEIIPYFSNFYPEQNEDLTFMQEIYNSDKIASKNQKCKVVAYISNDENNELVIPFKKIKSFSPTDKFVFLWNFKITDLPSGNYQLHIKVYDPKENLLCSDSLFFQRSNPKAEQMQELVNLDMISRDTLLQFIDYLVPISNVEEVNFILSAAKKGTDTLATFFTEFWKRRNPEDPLDAWYKYYKKVIGVNSKYSTLKLKGYKSDRGHYYLKYGAPNEMEFYPIEEGLYPYEIWHYYQLEDQMDIYFIFGNLDLSTNEFTMICSNKKNELYDPRWKLRLKPKDKRPFSIEETE